MVQVPTLSPQTSTVRPSTARFDMSGITPEAFGIGDIGDTRMLQAPAPMQIDLSGYVQMIENIALERKQTSLKELDTELSTVLRNTMYGNPEQEQVGFLSLQSNAAVDGHEAMRKDISEAVKVMQERADERGVGQEFKIASQNRVNQAYISAARHAANELKKANALASEARINSANLDASTDPSLLSASLATVDAEVTSQLDKQGIKDEKVRDYQLRVQRSRTIKLATDTALAQENWAQASSILNTYGGMMDPIVRADAYKAVAIKTSEQQALSLARDIRLRFPNQYDKQVEAAEAIDDLKLQDTVIDAILDRASDKVRVKKLMESLNPEVSADPEKASEAMAALILEKATDENGIFDVNQANELMASKLVGVSGQIRSLTKDLINKAARIEEENREITNGVKARDLVGKLRNGVGWEVVKRSGEYAELKDDADAMHLLESTAKNVAAGERHLLVATPASRRFYYKIKTLSTDMLARFNLDDVAHGLTEEHYNILTAEQKNAKYIIDKHYHAELGWLQKDISPFLPTIIDSKEDTPKEATLKLLNRSILMREFNAYVIQHGRPPTKDDGFNVVINNTLAAAKQHLTVATTVGGEYTFQEGPAPETMKGIAETYKDLADDSWFSWALPDIDLSAESFVIRWGDATIPLAEATPIQRKRGVIPYNDLAATPERLRKYVSIAKQGKYADTEVPAHVLEQIAGAVVTRDIPRLARVTGLPVEHFLQKLGTVRPFVPPQDEVELSALFNDRLFMDYVKGIDRNARKLFSLSYDYGPQAIQDPLQYPSGDPITR